MLEPGQAICIGGVPDHTTDKPNVVFFVIDGAAADLMSVYGYNRRTTPHLELLAAEGALFERAYSNASWTLPSTASFMTPLHHSVLGGFRNGLNVVPDNAPTMAQHMHRAGYQTAVFTANPNAGSMSGLDREVDRFRETWEEFRYPRAVREGHAESSRIALDAFWRWRETYPGAPYWVHFQTLDTHRPKLPVSPFAGLFLSPERREAFREWERLQREAGGPDATRFERAGVENTLSRERLSSTRHLVEHAAEREQISAVVDVRIALNLFRGHVSSGAHHLTGDRAEQRWRL